MANAIFNYNGLDKDVRIVVEQKTVEIRDRVGRAALNIFEVGERLIVVKERIGHTAFGKWLKAEFEWSEWTARKMMAVATSFKTVNFTDLKIAPSALYLLASDDTPPEVTEHFIDQAKDGREVKHKEVKAAIVKAKPKPAPKAAPDKPSTPPPVQTFYDDPPAGPPSPKPEPVKARIIEDEEGNKLTRMELAEVFGRRGELQDMMRTVSAVKTTVIKGADSGDELFRFINVSDFKARAETLYAAIKFALPHALCPAHADDPLARRGCRFCGGSGWLPAEKYQIAAAAHRKAVAK